MRNFIKCNALCIKKVTKVYKRIVEISLRGPHIQKQLSGKNVCKTMFISTISFRIMKAFANMSSQCQKRRFCV